MGVWDIAAGAFQQGGMHNVKPYRALQQMFPPARTPPPQMQVGCVTMHFSPSVRRPRHFWNLFLVALRRTVVLKLSSPSFLIIIDNRSVTVAIQFQQH